MTNEQSADVAIIGGGPAGYVAAIRATQLGGKVILVEKDKLGGVCLNVGCIPTKALIRSCEIFSLIQRADEFGLKVENSEINLKKLMERKKRIVGRLVGGVEYLLKKNKVQWIKGEAKILNSSTIQVKGDDEQEIKAKNIIIATGSYPSSIPLPGADEDVLINSTEALDIRNIPENLLIVGAGAIGVEFAYIYSILGSKVTIVEMLPRILPTEDAEVSEKLKEIMEKRKIKIFTQSTLASVKKEGENYSGLIKTPGGKEVIVLEKILVSIGRKPNSENLGLEKIGVETDEKGWIKVNSNMQTSTPNIYAAGDIVGGYLLAHVAYMEGEVAAENAMGEESKINYAAVPRFICSIPELAAVGLTEDEAKKKGFRVKVGRYPFMANGKAIVYGEREGMVKIVCDAKTKEILGVHILGPQATDLILEGVLAINLESTTQEIIDTVHPHPALGEAIREAALDAEGRALHM
ncbi:dihydrolipoyl dehydrogenase [Candidatus Aerophobetes bacterium]|nr:dihydrolipoyl dehydrogenase [Candidatus Aerophobetes bacterium]